MCSSWLIKSCSILTYKRPNLTTSTLIHPFIHSNNQLVSIEKYWKVAAASESAKARERDRGKMNSIDLCTRVQRCITFVLSHASCSRDELWRNKKKCLWSVCLSISGHVCLSNCLFVYLLAFFVAMSDVWELFALQSVNYSVTKPLWPNSEKWESEKSDRAKTKAREKMAHKLVCQSSSLSLELSSYW